MNGVGVAPAFDDAELARRAVRIADMQVVCEIESGCPAHNGLDQHPRWYDLRPLTDPREHCGEMIDMNAEIIDYALRRGLAIRHPEHAHLVRIAAIGGTTEVPGA